MRLKAFRLRFVIDPWPSIIASGGMSLLRALLINSACNRIMIQNQIKFLDIVEKFILFNNCKVK